MGVNSSGIGKVPLVVILNENEARKVLLLQAVESVAPELLPEAAIQEAERELTAPEEEVGQRILLRAERLLEHLPTAYRLLTAQLPWPWLHTVVPMAAFFVGLFSNVLGPEGHIHAIVNPMMVLILWNVVVVAFFTILRRQTGRVQHTESVSSQTRVLAVPRRPKRRSAEPDLPLPVQLVIWPILKLWAALVELFEPVANRIARSAVHVRVGGWFLSRYLRVCRHPILERTHQLLSFSAIVLAAGTIAGMYLRAIVFDYTVVWRSTLIESPETRLSLARLLFWPAAIVLGPYFPNAQTIAEMATDRGTAGAIWIHVFAISAIVYIVIPRSLLVYFAASESRKASKAVPVPVEPMDLERRPGQECPKDGGKQISASHEELAPAEVEIFRRDVTLEHFALDVNATSVMSSLQASLIERDVKNTKARSRFRDTLAFKRDWYQRWRSTVLAGFAAFPEAQRPTLYAADADLFHAGLARLPQSANSFAPQLIALELAAFEAYWPLASDRKGWTHWIGQLVTVAPALDKKLRIEFEAECCRDLGLPVGLIALLRNELQRVNRSLSGFWRNAAIAAGVGTAVGALTFGIAAPFIGGLVGHAMGLAGAAAVNAGLAALGGGAVAAGGLGVAGGTAVVVGGGALLGMGVGSLGVMMNPASVLIQAVKIEVFLRSIVVNHENAAQIVQAVLSQLRESIARMNDELKEARLNPEAKTSRIAEREKIIEILETCSRRCSSWAIEQKLLAPAGVATSGTIDRFIRMATSRLGRGGVRDSTSATDERE